MRLHLIYMMRNLYINSNLETLIKFSSNCRSTEFKDIIPWNISKMIPKTISIHTRIVISCEMRRSNSFWVRRKVNGNWDNSMIRIWRWRESYCRTNTRVRRRTARVTVSDSSRKRNYLSKFVRDRKIITDSTKSLNSTRTIYPVPTGCKVLIILSVKQTIPNLAHLLGFPNDILW